MFCCCAFIFGEKNKRIEKTVSALKVNCTSWLNKLGLVNKTEKGILKVANYF